MELEAVIIIAAVMIMKMMVANLVVAVGVGCKGRNDIIILLGGEGENKNANQSLRESKHAARCWREQRP